MAETHDIEITEEELQNAHPDATIGIDLNELPGTGAAWSEVSEFLIKYPNSADAIQLRYEWSMAGELGRFDDVDSVRDAASNYTHSLIELVTSERMIGSPYVLVTEVAAIGREENPSKIETVTFRLQPNTLDGANTTIAELKDFTEKVKINSEVKVIPIK